MADDGICDFGVHDLGRGQEAGGGVDGRLGVIELELGRLQGRSVAASVDLEGQADIGQPTLSELASKKWCSMARRRTLVWELPDAQTAAAGGRMEQGSIGQHCKADTPLAPAHLA